MHNSSLQNQPIQTMSLECSPELQRDDGKNINYLLFTQWITESLSTTGLLALVVVHLQLKNGLSFHLSTTVYAWKENIWTDY